VPAEPLDYNRRVREPYREKVGEKMTEEQVTFHNKAEIRVQAQIFTGRTLVSTCLANPGEIHTLQSGSIRYDIYLKNAATGWEIARKRDNEATTVILQQNKGHFILSNK
jgi:hypothetical protein